MFELSFSDEFLLCWGLVATIYAFKFKERKKKQIELRFGE
jgi:hypothetical protein